MKWSTANLKSPNYSENHELYVGTSTGTFKSEFRLHTYIFYLSHNYLCSKYESCYFI